MTKGLFLPLLVIFNLTCTSIEDVDKIANRIAENNHICIESILKSNDDLTSKRIKLEKCAYDMYKEIERESKDSISRKELYDKVAQIRLKKYSDFEKLYKLFDEKRQMTLSLQNNSNNCKEYFKDGDYVPVGNDMPIIIKRIGLKNIAKYTDTGYESISEVKWIDNCKYYLILKTTNCPEDINWIGDSLLVRVIDIKSDTIHFEIDMKIGNEIKTFPSIMRRINN